MIHVKTPLYDLLLRALRSETIEMTRIGERSGERRPRLIQSGEEFSLEREYGEYRFT